MDTTALATGPQYSLTYLLVIGLGWCVVMAVLADRILRDCDRADGTTPPQDTAPQ